MDLLKIGTIALMLPPRPLTQSNWLVVGTIIAIIIFIIYLAYSYVFKQKARVQQQMKEDKDETNKARK